MKKSEMRALYEKAKAAGMAAGVSAVPVPMAVSGGVPGGESKLWVEPEGACGFAWVNVKPGFSSFAKWLKEAKLASKSYYGGVDIWIGEHNQSVARKERHAAAMAKVLGALKPELAALPRRFVLADDDGYVYCEGVANERAEFEPLDMFGMPSAGATIVAYLNETTGAWEPL